jgi:hypothetical protein
MKILKKSSNIASVLVFFDVCFDACDIYVDDYVYAGDCSDIPDAGLDLNEEKPKRLLNTVDLPLD